MCAGLAAHVRPSSAFILARLCDTQAGAPRFEPETPLTSCTSVILVSSLQFLLGLAPEDRLRDLQRRFRAVSARQDRVIKLRGYRAGSQRWQESLPLR
jgi:hypothetical protein